MSTLFLLDRICVKLILDSFNNFYLQIFLYVYILHFYVSYIFKLLHILSKSYNNNDDENNNNNIINNNNSNNNNNNVVYKEGLSLKDFYFILIYG